MALIMSEWQCVFLCRDCAGALLILYNQNVLFVQLWEVFDLIQPEISISSRSIRRTRLSLRYDNIQD